MTGGRKPWAAGSRWGKPFEGRSALWCVMGSALAAAACWLSSASGLRAEAEELKIGYVNLAKVFDGYERTKASETDLEKQGKQKDAELQGRLNDLKKMREGLELLNDQAREAKTREIEQKSDDLQRFKNTTLRELGRERQKLADSILQDIQRTIIEYAKANGFSLILQQDKVVLYGQPAYDVTDEILKALNHPAAAKP